MSFDVNYHLLSSVTIASLLKNSNSTTYIHLHIIIFNGWNFATMKKLNSLKYKINNNSEFIFHNGQRAVKDFGEYITTQKIGIGEFARILAPIFAKEADRIIITDSGDIYFKKDLFELYNYPMEGKFVKGVIDPFTPCFTGVSFFNKDNYFNSGVLLIDGKLWREMNLYEDIVNIYNGFNYTKVLELPIQDILNHFFPSITVGNLPVRYNFQGVIDKNGNGICSYIYSFHCSKYFRKDEIFEEEKNIVIRHSNKCKVYNGEGPELKNEWNELAKLTGFYDEICQKYPKGC